MLRKLISSMAHNAVAAIAPPSIYKRKLRGPNGPIEVPVGPTTGVLDGWADFVRDHATKLQKMPDAFLTDHRTGMLNYDLRMLDALQDEMIDRTNKIVSIDVLKRIEQTACGHSDYIAKLSHQMYVLEYHLKKGHDQFLTDLRGYTYQL
jgi:hypothetical protein